MTGLLETDAHGTAVKDASGARTCLTAHGSDASYWKDLKRYKLHF